MRVVFRVDANEVIGSGHAMRCLTLADALRDQGAETLFVAAALPDSVNARLLGSGHQVARISGGGGLDGLGERWETARLSATEAAADARATLAAMGGPADWIIVDHYLLDHHWEAAARTGAERLCVIDDLANRPHDCDLLLDQNLGRSAADYRSLIGTRAEALCGPRYALLRPEFARERARSLERRRSSPGIRRVLVSLGSMDVGDTTLPALQAVLEAAPGCAVDVVLSAGAPSLAGIRRFADSQPAVNLHVDSTEMAELMRDADLAVGAAGSTSWERCCLGVPALVVVLADNQRFTARQLEAAGAVIRVLPRGDREAIAAATRDAIADTAQLAQISRTAAAICDGLGTKRVVDRLRALHQG